MTLTVGFGDTPLLKFTGLIERGVVAPLFSEGFDEIRFIEARILLRNKLGNTCRIFFYLFSILKNDYFCSPSYTYSF